MNTIFNIWRTMTSITFRLFMVGFVYFALLISFEAAQQYYYLTTFDLIQNQDVSFIGLFKSHAIRWTIWGILALPLLRYVLIHPFQNISFILLFQYFMLVLLTLAITLVAISAFHLWTDHKRIIDFPEYFSFFTYQKAALFVNAYIGLLVLIHLFHNLKLLDSKIIELSDLKVAYESLSEDLKQKDLSSHTPIIQIRIGNKLKNILLSEVQWVQSDDYCVKIHTSKGSYNLRKTMKSMEKELEGRGFIRIHRNALVSSSEIDVLSFSKKTITLKNGQIIPVATSRIPKIKDYLKKENELPA